MSGSICPHLNSSHCPTLTLYLRRSILASLLLSPFTNRPSPPIRYHYNTHNTTTHQRSMLPSHNMLTSYQDVVVTQAFPDEAESCKTYQDYKTANKEVDKWLLAQAGLVKHPVTPHEIYGGIRPRDLVPTAKAITAHNIEAPAHIIDYALKAIHGRYASFHRANRVGGPDAGHSYYLDQLEKAYAILTHASTPVVKTRPLNAATPPFRPSFIVSENSRPVASLA